MLFHNFTNFRPALSRASPKTNQRLLYAILCIVSSVNRRPATTWPGPPRAVAVRAALWASRFPARHPQLPPSSAKGRSRSATPKNGKSGSTCALDKWSVAISFPHALPACPKSPAFAVQRSTSNLLREIPAPRRAVSARHRFPSAPTQPDATFLSPHSASARARGPARAHHARKVHTLSSKSNHEVPGHDRITHQNPPIQDATVEDAS